MVVEAATARVGGTTDLEAAKNMKIQLLPPRFGFLVVYLGRRWHQRDTRGFIDPG